MDTSDRNFLSVKRASEHYDIPIGGLRGLLFRRENNGLNKAVVKLGRRILLKRDEFERWLLTHSEYKPP